MAQGLGISAMTAAYGVTGNERYLDIAQMAVEPFFLRIEDGGIVSDWDGRAFLKNMQHCHRLMY
jgi:hypothetical protein